MFARLSRLIRSFFNRFITQAENPTLILENNIQEMRSHIPQLNEAVAKSYGSVIVIQKQLGKYLEEVDDLTNKVKAALQLHEDQAARDIAIRLQDIKSRQDKAAQDLTLAQQNLDATQKLRDSKVREINMKIEEIKGAIEEHRFSEMQRSIAQLTDSTSAVDINAIGVSTDEMLLKLNQRTATNQGTFAASMVNNRAAITGDMIDQKAKEMQADQLLQSFKDEMKADEQVVSQQ